MAITLVLIFTCYFLLMVVLMLGWHRAVRRHDNATTSNETPRVTVLIPARNESHNIGHLLGDLSRQRYRNFEVIVIDDHSDDNTDEIVKECGEAYLNLELVKNNGVGKKAALTMGIGRARGPLIITTDADCRVPEAWISQMVRSFLDEDIHMVFGCVKMRGVDFFSALQAMEFTSVIGTGMAMAGLNQPIMCNGANLAFRKSTFEEVGGYRGNLHIPSGDDEFLMRKVLKAYPRGVRAVVHSEAVVTTLANRNMAEFVNQRIRWAGKWAAHQSLLSKALAAFVFCFQLCVVFLPFFAWLGWISLAEFGVLFFSKVGLELLFLRMVSGFLGVHWRWEVFTILEFVHPYYVVLIGFFSTFRSFEWKGRKLKSLTVSNN